MYSTYSSVKEFQSTRYGLICGMQVCEKTIIKSYLFSARYTAQQL